MSEDVLRIENLVKVYRGRKNQSFTAVDQISFSLKKGEILGLLGPNGAGKTTTIQMLLGILAPTFGSITYFGKDFRKYRSEVLQKVVFASAYVSLPGALTVYQNLMVFGRLYGLSKKETQRRMDSLLERFGMMDKKLFLVSQLSAGQVTRIMLIKAFMMKPKILLLDEPTASLDPEIAKDVREFILRLRTDGLSILFTSHNMAEINETCDRVLFLKKGKIIADDLPGNLAKSIATSRLQLIFGDGLKRTVAIADQLKFPYIIKERMIELQLDEVQIAQFLSALAHAGATYTQIQIAQPTLEDYFIHMSTQRKENELS